MSLSELAVIQSPLGSSRCIQVIAEFSSKKLARGVRLGEVEDARWREETKGRQETEKREEMEMRGERWSGIGRGRRGKNERGKVGGMEEGGREGGRERGREGRREGGREGEGIESSNPATIKRSFDPHVKWSTTCTNYPGCSPVRR